MPKLISTPLSVYHARRVFKSGNQLLDRYLHVQASQDVKRKLAACFVIEDENNAETIKGYYTLSACSVTQLFIPELYKKHLPPNYTSLPATLLGRLARDLNYKKSGIGELLLLDALFRSHLAAQEIASFAVILDPIDDKAIDFYQRYGFIMLPESNKLFLPMKTIDQLFN
jgi:predicted GNAT family N-acyltransferase